MDWKMLRSSICNIYYVSYVVLEKQGLVHTEAHAGSMNCLRPAHALCGACGLFPAANLSFFLLKRKLFRVLSFSEGNFPEIFPFQKETSPEKWPQRLLCEKFLAILPVFSRKVGDGVGERGRQRRWGFLWPSMLEPAAGKPRLPKRGGSVNPLATFKGRW